jgi:hypothetical protein
MKIFIRSIVIICSILVGFFANAQKGKVKKWQFSAGAEVLFPETSIRNSLNTGFGFSAEAEYDFTEHTGVTINATFGNLTAKKNIVGSPFATELSNLQIFALKPGFRYYLGNFYTTGEAGVAFLKGEIDDTRFTFTIGLGDKIAINKSSFLDVSVRHETWVGNVGFLGANGNPSVIGLRVAYCF